MKNMSFKMVNELFKKNSVPRFNNEIGDGWYHLLYDYFEVFNSKKEQNPKLRIDVIEEKFGTLYIGSSNGDEELNQIEEELNYRSESTCEFCGFPGERHVFGCWSKTCCDECAKIHGGAKPKSYSPIAFWGNFR